MSMNFRDFDRWMVNNLVEVLIEHRRWIEGALEENGHDVGMRERLMGHLEDVDRAVEEEIKEYEGRYGEAYQVLLK